MAAALLILSFPDSELWYLAWFALVPLLLAIEREKDFTARSTAVAWLFGAVFFFGSCWWLTFAPINYAGFPVGLAYGGMAFVALIAGIFPAIFGMTFGIVLRRYGAKACSTATFLWLALEFLRYWLTGNNWNAIGYSQAYSPRILNSAFVSWSGVYGAGFVLLFVNSLIAGIILQLRNRASQPIFRKPDLSDVPWKLGRAATAAAFSIFIWRLLFPVVPAATPRSYDDGGNPVVAVQPDVPMSGLDDSKLDVLRNKQFATAATIVNDLNRREDYLKRVPLVILPESPMNFMYTDDREFQRFIGDFARRNNASVLFNSAEPDAANGKYFNSAVMVGQDGRKIDEYDKIYLLPFGEAVPPLLEGLVPGFVGDFSYGREYDLLPVGDAKAGVMICFESHFGQLSREYVKNGADVIIEMTNDGYLGPTPVLRQHLANAVFRAVETNRPVLRVTNVGITAYIAEDGRVIDPAGTYQEATRVWSVSKSDGSQTFYVKYGDWFAWLCTGITVVLLAAAAFNRRQTRI